MNETQTLANVSSARDVLRQVEVNNTAMARLHTFYANYRQALMFQLDQQKPDLLALLSLDSARSSVAVTAVDTLAAKVVGRNDA